MLQLGNLPWRDPRFYAAGIPESEAHWVLLYSGMKGQGSGRYSFLALKPEQCIEANDFELFEAVLSHDKDTWENAWFGYLGYGLKDALEALPADSESPSGMTLPKLSMTQFGLILCFDHETQTVTAYGKEASVKQYIPTPKDALPESKVTVKYVHSNMCRAEYLDKVAQVQEALHCGDIYQANLTRKFYGELENANPWALFCKLSCVSPAPYSAFLKYGEQAVISSSPERFLEIDAKGQADMRPIKGSASRHSNTHEDEASKTALAMSEKDRAENLMIVDLCRNDLSRGCAAGSVKVDKLFAIESYATVHHMASTILGKKRAAVSSLELVKDCFPPGSMTGAPKIKAMEICSQLEHHARGVYAGAIGWFGGDGSVDLSVVIRTLIMDGNRYEFQVGGAIVLDSDAESEWQETLVKARGIGLMLGIDEATLAAL